MFSELDDIKNVTQTEVNACECKECIQMCKNSPCLGTPADILNLMKAGHGKRLVYTKWAAGIKQGFPVIPMIQPFYDGTRGCCTFLDQSQKKCTLHDAGLKPTEGKLANHIHGELGVKMGINLPIAHAVALTWTEPKNEPVIMEMVEVLAEQKNPVPNKPNPNLN